MIAWAAGSRPSGDRGRAGPSGATARKEAAVDEDDGRRYRVVVNDEAQYSIWPADREPPPGWQDAGRVGTTAECLEYVERVWTDLRPLSLRRAIEADSER